MIDQSLIKSNFIGRDGFRWWIGQIPPESTHGGQINGTGWGNRFKVRIMGYHPSDTTELPDQDLPWAQCLLSTTDGTGAGNNSTSVKISPGDIVLGFFLDGDNAQIPVIMGCFGRTSQVATGDYKNPFQPFTGYTGKVKKPNGTLKPDQSNESNAESQKSPRHVPPALAKSISLSPGDEISYFSGIGETVQFGNTTKNTTVDKISTEISNLTKKIQNANNFLNNLNSEIDRVSEKIQSATNELVGNAINSVYKQMIPIINSGLKALYKAVYAVVFAATKIDSIAHEAGVAAQKAMVNPVKKLQSEIVCLGGKIIGGLGSIIKGMLKSTLENVQNFVSCVANQFVGSLVNNIIDNISGGLSSAIKGLGPILKFAGGFSVSGLLRGSGSGIAGAASPLDCSQSANKSKGMTDQWTIGSGPKGSENTNFDDVVERANNIASTLSAAAGGISDVLNQATGLVNSASSLVNTFGSFASSSKIGSSSIGGCYSGPPKFCGPPKVKIFGGGGFGASAIPLFGGIVGSGSSKTGSIIGVKLVDPGSGYFFPPFVEFEDNCGQGYGAIARAVLEEDDSGRIKYIYVVSEGENYPIDEEVDYYLEDILVQESGENYNDGDVITDNFGNKYTANVVNGGIVKVTPAATTTAINKPVTDIPELTIESDTGFGAVLRPILRTEAGIFGEPIKSIDCVS
jgi:hypothetical protein